MGKWPYQGYVWKRLLCQQHEGWIRPGSEAQRTFNRHERCKEQERQCTLVSLQNCLSSWNELKKFAETFLSHVLFLENVNGCYSLGCFKVLPPNPSEGEIVEAWVSDPSHHRCFKNVIKHSSTDVPIVQNHLYRYWVLCCSLMHKIASCFLKWNSLGTLIITFPLGQTACQWLCPLWLL